MISHPTSARSLGASGARQVIALFALLVCMVATSLAQTVTVIYNFTGKNGFSNPLYVTPIQGRDGRLYGAAFQLSGGDGAVFTLTTTGGATAPCVFNGVNGSNPAAGVTLAFDGTLFGTTTYGGTANDGVLFRVVNGSCVTIHEFIGDNDGVNPIAAPIQGSDGNLYGTTAGTLNGPAATVYKYTPTGTFTTIYQFDQAHGLFPYGSLIQGTDGNLYGTASTGGANNCGTILKLATSGTLLWYYSFPCDSGGANPFGPLVQASDGNFYGTTEHGGDVQGQWGTIFKLSKGGVVTVLHEFNGNGRDGINPFAGLIEATDGNLYGATNAGGKYNLGTLYKITKDSAFTLLYSCPKLAGVNPLGSLTQHTSGILYGVNSAGGRFGFGSAYSLNVGLGPFIALEQYQGKVGGKAQILGQGLTGTTAVTFNGIAATSFNVISDTYMTVIVPSGATTGPVVVTTPTGKLTSNKNFRVVGTGITARSKQASLHAPQKSR